MRLIKLSPHLNDKAWLQRMSNQSDIRLFKYWQILYCIQKNPGKQAEGYALLLGTDSSKIYRLIQLYNKLGPNFTETLVWGGYRGARSLLFLNHEEELMEGLKQKAIKGEIITINNIRPIVEQKTKCRVSDDYL